MEQRMRVDIERSGSDYYELYAVNVDQHKTKLDHSLVKITKFAA